jgi:hypothetical protein
MEETMRPTTATDDNVFDFQALLHPGTVFEYPKDVVMHPSLTLAEKRLIFRFALGSSELLVSFRECVFQSLLRILSPGFWS